MFSRIYYKSAHFYNDLILAYWDIPSSGRVWQTKTFWNRRSLSVSKISQDNSSPILRGYIRIQHLISYKISNHSLFFWQPMQRKQIHVKLHSFPLIRKFSRLLNKKLHYSNCYQPSKTCLFDYIFAMIWFFAFLLTIKWKSFFNATKIINYTKKSFEFKINPHFPPNASSNLLFLIWH